MNINVHVFNVQGQKLPCITIVILVHDGYCGELLIEVGVRNTFTYLKMYIIIVIYLKYVAKKKKSSNCEFRVLPMMNFAGSETI